MRVRLPSIDGADLNLFEFDFDATYGMFLVNAEEKIYGRYGGRDGKNADNRISTAGLHYAMEAALDAHRRFPKEPELALPKPEVTRTTSDLRGRPGLGIGGRCTHCHQINEAMNAELVRSGKWTKDNLWRYPYPDNLGLVLEVDRGNVIKTIEANSSAAKAGLRIGDIVQRLNGLPVNSFMDAQFALDRAPKTGAIEVIWKREDKVMKAELALFDGWRRTDISWRHSLQRHVPAARLSGFELSAKDKEALGLSPKQLAFRQHEVVHSQAKDVGIQGGDIVIGVDDKKLEMSESDFIYYIRQNYVRGDTIKINVIRGKERLSFAMTLR